MDEINESRLRMAIDAITQKPKSWNQGTWGTYSETLAERLVEAKIPNRDYLMLPEGVTCGTSMCLAGQVVSQAGMPLLWGEDDPNADLCLDPETDEVFRIMIKARELLGLTYAQANQVFSGDAARLTHEEIASSNYDDLNDRTDDIERFKRNITHWTGVQFEEAAA
jgi:hypothetical protein